MRKKIISSMLAIAVVMGAISGCGNSEENAASSEVLPAETEIETVEESDSVAADENKLKVPIDTGIEVTSSDVTVRWGDQYGYYLLPIILDQGWFEDVFGANNITVEVSQFGSGPEMIEAFTTDAVDIGVMGVQPTISGKANGAEITTVAAFDDGSKASVIAAPANSDIKSIADLKGKNVGVALGTIFHSHLVWALNQEGIDPSEVNMVNIDWSGVGNILEQGEVDAAVGDYSDFYNTSVADNFEFNYLGDATGSGTQDQVIVGRTEFMETYPDIVENILVIFQEAADFLDEHPEEAVQINADYFGLGTDTIQAALDTNDFGIFGGERFRTDYDNYIQFMYDNDLVLERIDVDSILDYTYLDATDLAAE